MAVKVGLDVGGSSTKIVAMNADGKIFYKHIVKAEDPVTSAFGALGRLLDDNSLSLEDISQINITGVGSSFPSGPLLGIKTVNVTEFLATGLGGLYLSGLEHAVVVSLGTGTAYLDASHTAVKHIIGSGVGGGTLLGLCNSMFNISDPNKLSELASAGEITNVDLTIGDISKAEIPGLTNKTTASNFGKVSEDLSKEDKALGVFNLVYQTAGSMSVLAARLSGLNDVVFTGQLTSFPQCHQTLAGFQELYNTNFIIPEDAEFGTAIGACLAE